MDFTEELSDDEAAVVERPVAPVPDTTPGIADHMVERSGNANIRIIDAYRATPESVVLSELQSRYGAKVSELGWIDRDSIRVTALPVPEVDSNSLCSQVVYRNVGWSYRAFRIVDGDAIPCVVYRVNDMGTVYCGARLHGSRVMDVYIERGPLMYGGTTVESVVQSGELVQGDIVTVRILAQRRSNEGLVATGVILGVGEVLSDLVPNADDAKAERGEVRQPLTVEWVGPAPGVGPPGPSADYDGSGNESVSESGGESDSEPGGESDGESSGESDNVSDDDAPSDSESSTME